MTKKTNSGLVAYVKAKVGCYYWYGCFGQMASKSLYLAKKKQYPKYYTAKNYEDQIKNAKQVFDCAGLIKAYLWTDSISDTTPTYNASQDYSANSFYNAAKKKGKIASMKAQDGLLVFKGTSDKKTHVGVYAGGYVYEAKGHAYGVVRTKFNSSWTYWCQCHLLEDDTGNKPKGGCYMFEVTTVKKGTKGNDTLLCQELLYAKGYKGKDGKVLKMDGDCGDNTVYAINSFQTDMRKKGIECGTNGKNDGSCGQTCWKYLLGT